MSCAGRWAPLAALSGVLACHSGASDPAATAAEAVNRVTCSELASGDFSTLVFGTAPAARGPFDPPPPPPLPAGTGENVRFLLARTWPLRKASEAFERELIQACTELGVSAGVALADLRADPDNGHGAERACNAAATRVASIFRRAKETRVLLDVSVGQTRCYEDVEATLKCLADCGAPVAGDPRLHCIGGEIVGLCHGRCAGSCVSPGGAGVGACQGSCSGHCDREFRGTCGGQCRGTCDGAPLRGAKPCAGTCDGSCSERADGSCGGRCDGSCAGTWVPPPTGGACQGICVGTCVGTVSAPACSGEVAPRSAEAVCRAACGASAVIALHCDPPVVRVALRAGRPKPELERVLAGVQSAVPKIVRLLEGPGKRIPHAVDNAVAAAVEWSNAFATVGPKPLLCIRADVDALKDAANGIILAARGAEAVAPAIHTDPIPVGRPTED